MREPGIMPWLAVSIVASVVLTVVLNVAIRVFPGAGRRVAQAVARLTLPSPEETRSGDRRVRVFIPWKAMIIGSVVLTIVVNVALWMTR